MRNCERNQHLCHISGTKFTSKEAVIELVNDLIDLIHPGFYGNGEIDRSNIEYHIGNESHKILQKLTDQIYSCTRQQCKKVEDVCTHCIKASQEQALTFLEKILTIRDMLLLDLYATFKGDPAAKSYDEIIFSYPGYFAITVYRIAHELHKQQIPLLPRIMTEYAHTVTGVDIHPGAKIGKSFFIDHGTGVVIGETTEIGDNVTMYQGVTLGALSFKKMPDGSLVKGGKRHPTIGNNVTIYSHATILGGETAVGDRSVIGGNVWLTHSIPPDTVVILAEARLKTISKNMQADYQI